MRAVGLPVEHVVDQVGGARGGAVGDEGRRRLQPAVGVPELRGEDDAGEDEQVLRPLLRPHGDERGPRGGAPGQRHDAFCHGK